MLSFVVLLGSCKKDDNPAQPAGPTAKDPNTAAKASIDRFSATAGNLFVRTQTNGLPAANQPVNFDQGEPFITQGLGPNGNVVKYYNFDVQSTTPAPIYVLFREGESTPVSGQLNIVDVIPGDAGYNDFWQVMKVTVPAGYVANVVASKSEIDAAGYTITPTTMLVNCPIVPEGSTASLRLGGGDPGLIMGWYKDQVIFYFSFVERNIMTTGNGSVPVSAIYVTFNINPTEPGGGPPSGFKTETGSAQTHNVVATLPSNAAYSPLWMVDVYDNMDFGSVSNLSTATAATILATGVANVNCPIVSQQ